MTKLKTSISYLPRSKQRELARIVETILDEFEQEQRDADSQDKKGAQILKIILYGSYARDEWVDEPHTSKGYMSDYDIIVIVSDESVTEDVECWHRIEERIIRCHPRIIRTPMSLIVHSLRFVNQALNDGRYFFLDIVRDGIALYDSDDEPLNDPKPLTPKKALKESQMYFDKYTKAVKSAIQGARFYLDTAKGKKFVAGEQFLRDGAFMCHQAVERAYYCLLLVMTLYVPSTHDIKSLRSLAEEKKPRLIGVWPRFHKRERRLFELLRRAYVEARYSPSYEIKREELIELITSAGELSASVGIMCKERLEELREGVGK